MSLSDLITAATSSIISHALKRPTFNGFILDPYVNVNCATQATCPIGQCRAIRSIRALRKGLLSVTGCSNNIFEA